MFAFSIEFIAGMLSAYFEASKTPILKIFTIFFLVFSGVIGFATLLSENTPLKSATEITLLISVVLAITAMMTINVWYLRKYYQQKKKRSQ